MGRRNVPDSVQLHAGGCQQSGSATSFAAPPANGGESSGDESSDGSEASSGEGDLAFPASYADGLTQLLMLSSQQNPVQVKDLPLPNKEQKLGLVTTLWEEGYLCTVPQAAKVGKTAVKSANGGGGKRKRQ